MKSKIFLILASIVGGFLVLLLLAFLVAIRINNQLVSLQESVDSALSQIQNQYQRRLDLIPNLVETVKGYAQHEKSTLKEVIEARARATGITLKSDTIDNDISALKKFQKAQGDLTSALSRLMVVAENYPNLKANENFLELQSQLEGTENRIAVERGRYNEIVREYNTKVRLFPSSFIAALRGFAPKPYFESDEEAKKAPKVKF